MPSRLLEGVDHDGTVKVHVEHPRMTGEGLCGARKSFPPGYEDGVLQPSQADMINCARCCELIRAMGGVRMAPRSEQI